MGAACTPVEAQVRLSPSWEMTPDWQGEGQTVRWLKGSSVCSFRLINNPPELEMMQTNLPLYEGVGGEDGG